MRLVTTQQLEALLSMARLRAADDRLTAYTREQARENIAALEELQVYRKGIAVEGVIRDERVEAVWMPQRIQRKRTKGWRMPAGAVYVGRPTCFGNNFSIAEYGRKLAVFNFRQRMRNMQLINPSFFDLLRGKDLACWCPLDQPCHADVLLEIANAL